MEPKEKDKANHNNFISVKAFFGQERKSGAIDCLIKPLNLTDSGI